MKKLWSVNVSIEFDMPVVAETADEAEKIARRYADDDMSNNYNVREDAYYGRPVSIATREELPGDWEGSYAYGDKREHVAIDALLPKVVAAPVTP